MTKLMSGKQAVLEMLKAEGIVFSASGRCDLKALRFFEFEPL